MNNKNFGLSRKTISRNGFKTAIEVYDKFNRKCSVCGNENDLTIHHIDGKGRNYVDKGLKANNSIDNLILICRKCHGSIHSKERWEKQLKLQGGYLFYGREKEYYKKWCKKYYAEHREKKKEYSRKYRIENKEKCKKGLRKWCEENQNKIGEYRKRYYQKNKEKNKKYAKEYRKSHPEYHKMYRAKVKLNKGK